MSGLGFIEANGLIALGVSADAAALTICDFEANRHWRRALAWIAAVTLTHSLLPVAGLAGVGLAADLLPAARAALYAGGGLVSALLLWTALRGAVRSRSAGAIAANECPASFLGKVAIVSLDAALIGPGAAAVTRDWTGEQFAASLALSALFVATILSLAAGFAWWVARRVQLRSDRAATLYSIAQLGQCGIVLPIFAYFVLAALASLASS